MHWVFGVFSSTTYISGNSCSILNASAIAHRATGSAFTPSPPAVLQCPHASQGDVPGLFPPSEGDRRTQEVSGWREGTRGALRCSAGGLSGCSCIRKPYRLKPSQPLAIVLRRQDQLSRRVQETALAAVSFLCYFLLVVAKESRAISWIKPHLNCNKTPKIKFYRIHLIDYQALFSRAS